MRTLRRIGIPEGKKCQPGTSHQICGGSKTRTDETMKLIEGYAAVEQAIRTIEAATTQPELPSSKR